MHTVTRHYQEDVKSPPYPMTQTTSASLMAPSHEPAQSDLAPWDLLSASTERVASVQGHSRPARQAHGRGAYAPALSQNELRLATVVAGIIAMLFGLAAAHATTTDLRVSECWKGDCAAQLVVSQPGAEAKRDTHALMLVSPRAIPTPGRLEKIPLSKIKREH